MACITMLLRGVLGSTLAFTGSSSFLISNLSKNSIDKEKNNIIKQLSSLKGRKTTIKNWFYQTPVFSTEKIWHNI